MLDDLADAEQALVDAACEGRELICAGDTEIRAELIRELLLGKRGELAPRGVQLRQARLTGEMDLEHVTAVAGLSLVDCDIPMPVNLYSTTVPWLVLHGSRLGGVHASRLRVGGDVVLSAVTISGADSGGLVRLGDAHVGGNLSLARAEVHNETGPALNATRLRMGGVMLLGEARMSGRGDDGVMCMHGAHIGGEVDMRRVELRSDNGPALNTTNLTVDSNMFLDRAEVSGRGNKGALRLSGARVGGLLVLDGADIGNVSGPGLRADGVHVGGELNLRRARVSGSRGLGAIHLRSARIAYDVHIVNSEVRNDAGPALFADQLEAEGILHLRGTRLLGMVRLVSARVGGRFSLIDTTIDALDVNDFSYGSLDGVDWRQWLDLLRNHTEEYRPSPYQQLAAVERAAGHDGNARNILIAQQHDLRHRAPRALGGPLTRRFHWLWGALAGYGYRARRTALALLVALVAAGGVSLWAGHVTTGPGRHAAEHTATTTAPGTPCSPVELVGLGLDRGLPLGPTGLRSRCDLDTGTTAGQVFTVLLWVVQAAVWGLATLALAGYTSLIRKTV